MEEVKTLETEQTTEQAAEPKKSAAPSKKELYDEIEQLKRDLNDSNAKNIELAEYAENAQRYIDRLYNNSNVMNNQLESVKHHIDSLNKTTAIIEELFELHKEKVNYINAILDTHNKTKGNKQNGIN